MDHLTRRRINGLLSKNRHEFQMFSLETIFIILLRGPFGPSFDLWIFVHLECFNEMNQSKIAEIYQNKEFMCALKSFFLTNRNNNESLWLFLA